MDYSRSPDATNSAAIDPLFFYSKLLNCEKIILPYTTKTISPMDGTYDFGNGITFEVPTGAVSQLTEIKIRPFSESEKAKPLSRDMLIENSFLVGFVNGGEAIHFNKMVTVVFTLSTAISSTDVPMHVIVDPATGDYFVPKTVINYDPDTNTLTMEIDKLGNGTVFRNSDNNSAAKGQAVRIAEENRRAQEYCSDPVEGCKCKSVKTKSSYTSTIGAGDCQKVVNITSVTFKDCPGKPIEVSGDNENSKECTAEQNTLTLEIVNPKSGETYHGLVHIWALATNAAKVDFYINDVIKDPAIVMARTR